MIIFSLNNSSSISNLSSLDILIFLTSFVVTLRSLICGAMAFLLINNFLIAIVSMSALFPESNSPKILIVTSLLSTSSSSNFLFISSLTCFALFPVTSNSINLPYILFISINFIPFSIILLFSHDTM